MPAPSCSAFRLANRTVVGVNEDLISLNGAKTVDSLNMFEQVLAPAIVNDPEAIVPKTHSSPETVRDERFRVLYRQIATGALRTFRHSLCHEISFRH